MANIKTIEEHIFYLEETIKLSLWAIAIWKNEHPDEDIIYTIHERTPLLNHTIFNNGHTTDDPSFSDEKWSGLREELKKIYIKNSNPALFEKKGFELLQPYIMGRVERDMSDLNWIDDVQDGSWIKYDLNQKGEYLEFHMENFKYPNSFLSDKTYFYNKLKEAVSEADENGFKGLWSRSWLNTYPNWIKLMPDEWNSSVREQSWDLKWDYGYWGQFITSNEGFNIRNGELFRKHGKIPYPCSYAEASIKSFKDFLKTIH